jgi:hypothetical protein
MQRSRVFLAFLALQVLLLAGLYLVAGRARAQQVRHDLPVQRELVRALQLTDLALWTEARYTRHPSQADRFAPFQDGPASLEHFPAGSVVEAPKTRGRVSPPQP